MEQFGTLKRRTTDLMSNIPKPNVNMPNMPSELPQFPKLADLSSKLPAMPKMPAFGGYSQPAKPTLKATWERIDVPPIPRSSHSINIVAGNAYIFGGEINPRQPVDNDMHVIVLPFSSAGADCYKVKAKAAPKPEPPKIPTVVEPIDEDKEGKEKELSEVPLASPSKEGDDAGPDTSVSKGKEPAGPDFYTSSLGDVPTPRVGHATAVIGTRIFLFGGRGGPDMQPLEERGRVWVFDTKTHLWSYLDPYLPTFEPSSPAFADKHQHYPAARSYHAAASIDQPREFSGSSRRTTNTTRTGPGAGPGGRGLKRTTTWTEWAQGDSDVVGTPQRPIVGNVANNSRDEDDEGFGTLIVHGGCFAEGRTNDTWAFDVHSRVWQELPSAPGKPRGGTSIAIAGGKLWRFGGFNGETEEGGQLDYLQLGVDEMLGQGDVVLSAKGSGWKSVLAGQPSSAADAPAPAPAAEEEEEGVEAAKPLTAEAEKPHWPGHRSVAGFQTVTIGGVGGREYLLLAFGERDPSDHGHEAAGKFWNDVWAYELSRGPGAAASVMDAFSGWASWGRNSISNKSGGEAPAPQHHEGEKGKWFKVETEAYDDDDGPAVAEGPGPRGWFASAPMGELEERGIVYWGGLDGTNRRLGDGWILRLGGEKREL